MKVEISAIRHAWPEKKPFFGINRPNGFSHYVFIHLFDSVDMNLCGETFRTKPSACVFYDLDMPQLWKTGENGIVHDWIHMDGDVPLLMERFGLEFGKIYYPPPHVITDIVRKSETEYFAGRSYRREMCEAKLCELMIEVSRASDGGDTDRGVDDEMRGRLMNLRTLMFSNLSEKLNVPEMAKAMSVSESKFYSAYKQVFGISPIKDMINARTEAAKNYLLSGKYSVSDVAAIVGYDNEFHFIRQFRAMTGVTPGKYRENTEITKHGE